MTLTEHTAFWPVVTSTILLAGTAWMAYRALRSYLIDLEAVRLRAQAKALIDRRVEHLSGRIELRSMAAIMAEDLTNRDTSALIVDREGRPIGVAPPHEGPKPPLLSLEEYRRTLEGDPHVTYVLDGEQGGQMLVVLIPPLEWLPRPPAIVQLTIDLVPVQRMLKRLVLALFGGLTLVLTAALVIDEVLGGPYELLALLALPLIALFARWARGPREERVTSARELDVEPEPAVDVPRPEFRTLLERTEAAFLATRASEQRIRDFVADASHELRTPLTTLGMAADLLAKEARDDPERVEQIAKVMRTQADRMGRLVEDLLILARLDLEHEMERVPVELDELVSEYATELAVAPTDHPIEVDVEPMTVQGDPVRLRQVLANLVSNALRHSPPGGAVRISVTQERGAAVLAVEDRGEGIEPEHLPHLFDRFYRVNPERAGTGAGLGLTIVKEIVGRLGGEVSVDSQPGRGSIFRVRLPLRTEEREEAESALDARAPAVTGLVELDTMELLEALHTALATFSDLLALLGG